MGLTGFVIIHVFIASFSPAREERNQMVNTKFTRPVNAMPMSNSEQKREIQKEGEEGKAEKGGEGREEAFRLAFYPSPLFKSAEFHFA